MKAPVLPLPDTPAFAALARIQALGGSAFPAQLMSMGAANFSSHRRFDQLVLRPLVTLGFVTVAADAVRLTASGRDYLESRAASPALVVSPIPRFRHFVYEERRPGSFDYRMIPSMIAGRRVPFKCSSLDSAMEEECNGDA
jgi:hypothetical protein